MRFLRSSSGFTLRGKIKSEDITKNCKVEKIIDDIQIYQQKWNQHVLRMSRKALQYRPKRKRDLGRPYRRWKNQFM